MAKSVNHRAAMLLAKEKGAGSVIMTPSESEGWFRRTFPKRLGLRKKKIWVRDIVISADFIRYYSKKGMSEIHSPQIHCREKDAKEVAEIMMSLDRIVIGSYDSQRDGKSIDNIIACLSLTD